MEATLIVHAIGAPIGAALAAWLYFRRFGCTGPLATAAVFVATALALDAVIVAPPFERSYAMFSSLLGMWIPQALIFAATWLTGSLVGPRVPGAGCRVAGTGGQAERIRRGGSRQAPNPLCLWPSWRNR